VVTAAKAKTSQPVILASLSTSTSTSFISSKISYRPLPSRRFCSNHSSKHQTNTFSFSEETESQNTDSDTMPAGMSFSCSFAYLKISRPHCYTIFHFFVIFFAISQLSQDLG
jgi:hypothetical protein